MEKLDESKKLRYERKFITTELNSKEIESLIKANSAIFKEIFYKRKINNIYLDSLDLKSYQENIAGVSERLKIRIRWYGPKFGLIKKPILELKMKKGKFGEKLYFPLNEFIFGKKFTYNKLKKVFLNSNLPKWLNEKLKFCQLSLFNSYDRKYFISSDKKYRVTIDKNLIFYKINNANNLFNEKIEDSEKIVIELKYSLKDFRKSQKISQEFPFRLTANSKYCSGVSLLEL
jgi:hypothetical protein